VPFFAQPHTEYITVALVFVAFMAFYWKMKDYFVIVCTALIGSFFIILGMSYSGMVSMDLLFNLELGKFKNLDALVT
jgi:hypothetical protein